MQIARLDQASRAFRTQIPRRSAGQTSEDIAWQRPEMSRAHGMFQAEDGLVDLQNMNSILVSSALKTVVNPNVLVNMVSQRVRQLNSGGGGTSRPLVSNVENVSAADIALREIIEEKMDFTMPESIKLTRPTARNRRRPQHWAKG